MERPPAEMVKSVGLQLTVPAGDILHMVLCLNQELFECFAVKRWAMGITFMLGKWGVFHKRGSSEF